MQPSFERGTKSENANSGLSKANAALLGVVYSTVLASLPMDLFQDRSNYLDYAEASLEILAGYAIGGPLSVLFNEPLWLLMNAGLSSFLSPDLVVRTFVFCSAYVAAYYILRSRPKSWYFLLLFLLVPQVMKKFTTHIRQGVAISVFICGWFSKSKSLKFSLLSVTPLIHSSFFFVLFIYYLTSLLNSINFSSSLQATAHTIFGLFVVPSSLLVASLVGARQANRYQLGLEDVSGFGFIFWLTIAVLFLMQNSSYIKSNMFSLGGLIFYLSGYFLSGFVVRAFESFIPILLVSGLDMSSSKRKVFIFLILLYSSMQWSLELIGVFSSF